jgi:eukaryotic-like serine/threonine-protein kinase
MLDRARVREVYLDAAELAQDQQPAFLDRACGGDAELRAEVESLLAAAAVRPEFLGSPTADPGIRDEAIGTRIGPYRLLQEIGHGGFGTVYMAEQDQPVHRRVALKVIKLGMDTRAVIARFEAERQALALMDHPNIARVIDAGATDSGRPYFVMELVRGEPITAYCDRAQMSVPQRLELFIQVCHAVQHAHSKGVTHRDLKPANILVSTEDGHPHAKVIDFGIAKATEQRLTGMTVFTDFRQFIGTPQYMSPEQAEGSLNVDTRSDVYSLGVLLYELLTGETPFDPRELRSAAYGEIQRIIREVEPERPSTKLSRSASLDLIAAQRHTEPRRLSALLRGDLDWIVMRALEKDRARRYDTASALAADLARHLTGEPVEAAPPSRAYRVRKFVRRNRPLVASGAAIFGLLLLGVLGTSAGLARANAARAEEKRQRTAAQESAALAVREAERAARAESQALARADELERVAAFQSSQLAGINPAQMGWLLREDLVEEARAAAARSGDPDPDHPSPEELERLLVDMNLTNVALRSLDRNIFQRAVEAINEQFDDQPLVAARLLQTCGESMDMLGLLEGAIGVHRRALDLLREAAGDDDVRTLKAADKLGRLLTKAGQFGKAEPLIRGALEGLRRQLGEDAFDTLASHANLGALLQEQGKFSSSEEVFLEVLAHLRRPGRPESDRSLLSWVLGNLATTVEAQGRLHEAEALMREVVELRQRGSGDDHPDTLAAKSNLAAVLHANKKRGEATDLTKEVLEASRRVLGDDHPNTLTQMSNLGVMYALQNRLGEAIVIKQEALERLRRRLGKSHPKSLTALNNLALDLVQRGEFAAAAELFEEGLEASNRPTAATLPIRAMLLHHQADALDKSGDLDRAKRAAVESVEMYEAHPDWNPREASHADQVLLNVLRQRRELGEAEGVIRRSVERARQETPPTERGVAAGLELLGDSLLIQGRFAEAETAVRECVEIRTRAFPEGDVGRWRLHHARGVLGDSLIGQAADPGLDTALRLAKIREADGLVIEAYVQLRDDTQVPAPSPASPRDRRQEALERIIALYETWAALEPGAGHDARANEWRARAADLPGNP